MMRILIVEGHDCVQSIIRDFCDKIFLGADCVMVSDGAEAYNLMEREMFDFAIINCRADRIDGIELCKKAQETILPVILISSYDWNLLPVELIRKAKCYGINSDFFLKKPFSLSSFVDKAEDAMRMAV